MTESESCPLTHREAIDLWFLENRAKVLDIAAFLDRLDRTGDPEDDFRIAALRNALSLLIDGQGDRTRRIQLLLSDRSSEPIEAAPTQGAFGAPLRIPEA
ncbi:MAG: hypothetical protein MK100_07395 [Phycisphaerales bacterium]|nr:hypothetical protein [Phycisphaerales bacterium]